MERLPADFISADIRVALATHEGMVGKNNEDYLDFASYQVNSGDASDFVHLAVVADGVGGQMAGEFASRYATETIHNYFAQLRSFEIERAIQHIELAVAAANIVVYERAQNDPDLEGMATTVVVAVIFQGLLFTAHVGDSRIYLLRQENLIRLTRDHSWVQEALDAGLLTPEQAREHPNKNIIRRSLGTTPEVEVDVEMVTGPNEAFGQAEPIEAGDVVLLCTDGLTDMISEQSVRDTFGNFGSDVSGAARMLVDKANAAGGRDNITLIILQATSEFVTGSRPDFMMPSTADDHGNDDGGAAEHNPIADQIYQYEPATIRSMPKVASVPLNEQLASGRTRAWRLFALIIGVLLLVLALIILLISFGVFPV